MSLGVVLTPYGHTPGFPPYGIAYSRKGAATWQAPFDPQWYSTGEAGYYYDTHLGDASNRLGTKVKPPFWYKVKRAMGLGAIPTDFEIAKSVYDHLPVYSGWVTTQQGYQSGGWQPPKGRYPGFPSSIAPPMAPLNGLGETPIPPVGQQLLTIEDVLAVQQAQNDRVFSLTAISTVAVTVSALIGIFRTIKLIKEDK